MFQTMFKKICGRGQSPNFYKTKNLKEEKIQMDHKQNVSFLSADEEWTKKTLVISGGSSISPRYKHKLQRWMWKGII